MANFGFRFKGDKTCFEVVSDDYQTAETFDLYVNTSPCGRLRFVTLHVGSVDELVNSCHLYNDNGDFRDQAIVMEYVSKEEGFNDLKFTITIDFSNEEWTHVIVEW